LCAYYDSSYQDDDNTVYSSEGISASMSKGDSYGGGVNSFDTNNQVKGVDEGM